VITQTCPLARDRRVLCTFRHGGRGKMGGNRDTPGLKTRIDRVVDQIIWSLVPGIARRGRLCHSRGLATEMAPGPSTPLSRERPARRLLAGAGSGRGVDPWALVRAPGRPTRWTSSRLPSQRRREQTRHNVDKERRRAARVSGRLPLCAAAAAQRLRVVLRRSGISQVQTCLSPRGVSRTRCSSSATD
jgi:hypothetical protein